MQIAGKLLLQFLLSSCCCAVAAANVAAAPVATSAAAATGCSCSCWVAASVSADTFLIFKQLVSVFSASNHKQATRGGKGRRAAAEVAAEAAGEQQQVEQGRQQGSTAAACTSVHRLGSPWPKLEEPLQGPHCRLVSNDSSSLHYFLRRVCFLLINALWIFSRFAHTHTHRNLLLPLPPASCHLWQPQSVTASASASFLAWLPQYNLHSLLCMSSWLI